MAASNLKQAKVLNERRIAFVGPIVVLWGVVALAVGGLVWVESDIGRSLQDFYLVPWVFLASICVLGPSVYLLYTGKFDVFHPLVFAAWSYVFPALVIGGLLIAFGVVSPYFLPFIEDPEYNLPLTLVYVSVGFLGLTVGFALPFGQKIASVINERLPAWQWEFSETLIPAISLMFIGIAFNLIGVIQGIMGYQLITEIGMFDSFLGFLVIVLSIGSVLIWLAIFGSSKKTGVYYLSIVIAVLFIPIRMVLLGSRSSLFLSIVLIAMAFYYSGRKLKTRHAVIFGSLLLTGVFLGVVYGTTFRNIKGTEARLNAGDYFGLVADTISYISTEDPIRLTENSFQSLAERVENLSSLGVVVANYEKLAPYEESYGLNNNIINDATTAFVPRFLWPDKPNTSDARAYSDLYFNYGENSFAISPFGDLLRNFGPIGIPVGMLFLGIYKRIIYASLINTPNPAIWKKAAYYPLLTLVSYEAFYAHIFPAIIRTLFVLTISLLLANLLVTQIRKSRS